MSERARLTGGYAKILSQVVEYVEGELEFYPQDLTGDSPIERLFFAALSAHIRFCEAEYKDVLVPVDSAHLGRLLAEHHPLALIVQPQAQLEGWRVDFMIYAWDFGRATGRQQWRRLIVECDGHDFHERTKEQAKKDRSRDRQAQLLGMTVLRFTGHELHSDPLGCARQVSEWGTMGW